MAGRENLNVRFIGDTAESFSAIAIKSTETPVPRAGSAIGK